MAGPPPGQGAPPPAQYYPPPPPGQPPKRDTNVLIVVVILVVIFILVPVVAAVLYVLTTGIGPDGGRATPDVALGNLKGVSMGRWTFEVAGVSRLETLSRYEVIVLNGTSVAIPATSLEECEAGGCAGGGLRLVFTDLTRDDTLNAGDFFDLSGGDVVSDYAVILVWKPTGGQVGRIEIQQ